MDRFDRKCRSVIGSDLLDDALSRVENPLVAIEERCAARGSFYEHRIRYSRISENAVNRKVRIGQYGVGDMMCSSILLDFSFGIPDRDAEYFDFLVRDGISSERSIHFVQYGDVLGTARAVRTEYFDDVERSADIAQGKIFCTRQTEICLRFIRYRISKQYLRQACSPFSGQNVRVYPETGQERKKEGDEQTERRFPIGVFQVLSRAFPKAASC